MTSPANWHPDPTGRHHHRYWDGVQWTEHVSDNGVTSRDPVTAQGNLGDTIDRALTVDRGVQPEQVQRQIADTSHRGAGITALPSAVGGGTLFTEPILVVNQKAKLIEVTNQYTVFDKDGTPVGFVNQVGQSAAKKALRVLTNIDQFLTHKLEITDRSGQVVMRLTRPGKVFKSTVIVENGAGQEVGRIVQDNVFGKIHFALQSGGQTIGAIKAENWRAWNFRIEDAAGTEVARITKTFEGFMKMAFTTADNYVVQIHHQLADPLLTLVVASALSVDTALKQDDKSVF
jgi:uncharacterized protein YxjI